LLSTLEAFLLQTDHPERAAIVARLERALVDRVL
jgi:hypothetical protein